MNSLFGSEYMFMVDGVKILKYVSQGKKSSSCHYMYAYRYNTIGTCILKFCF